jgi:Flp pilus assembly protein TadD
MGEKGEAIKWLHRAVELHPKQPWGWVVQLGDWLAEAGDEEGALAACRQALDLSFYSLCAFTITNISGR